jgi:hypothetical protein
MDGRQAVQGGQPFLFNKEHRRQEQIPKQWLGFEAFFHLCVTLVRLFNNSVHNDSTTS